MILLETVTSFLQEIISFPDFKLSTSALQQQIQHLLFLVNITDCCSDLDNVIEEHKKLLVRTRSFGYNGQASVHVLT